MSNLEKIQKGMRVLQTLSKIILIDRKSVV